MTIVKTAPGDGREPQCVFNEGDFNLCVNRYSESWHCIHYKGLQPFLQSCPIQDQFAFNVYWQKIRMTIEES